MPESKMFVAVVGVGLVGSELVDQILAIPEATSPFQLISLSNSRHSIFDPTTPIAPGTDWRSRLAASPEKADLNTLTDKLATLVSPSRKVTLVDNTSAENVATLYPTWLEKGINVVTPNKKAYSGHINLYDRILSAGKSSGARYLNEATVGAGLPIISTLKELVATGDKVVRIEGVLSGTMSYIFNEFSTGKPDGPSFSSVVKVAREKGYTEPHPADDLNGFDVARKLTILSRTISSGSYSPTPLPVLESFKSVQITSLVPPELENIANGDEFLARLPRFDGEFDKLRAQASANSQVLRYVGVVDLERGIVRAGLEKYFTNHPFATSLGGSDNIILFHTQRYGARPLIVQGAGAGAAVTAMGVLGDLFKLV